MYTTIQSLVYSYTFRGNSANFRESLHQCLTLSTVHYSSDTYIAVISEAELQNVRPRQMWLKFYKPGISLKVSSLCTNT